MFTPLCTIAYIITNSMENLRFDKEVYSHVLDFYTGYFIKEIKNILSRVVILYVIEILVEVWENSKLRENPHPTGSSSHFNISFSQISTRVCITVWRHGKCFLFLKYNLNVETNYHNKLTVLHSEFHLHAGYTVK